MWDIASASQTWQWKIPHSRMIFPTQHFHLGIFQPRNWLPEGTQLAEVFLARKGPWSPVALYLSKRQEGAKRAPGNGLRGCLEFGVLLDIYLIKDPQTKTSKKSTGKPLKTVTTWARNYHHSLLIWFTIICMIFIIIDIVIMDMIDMAKEIDGQEPGTGPDQRARGLWKTAGWLSGTLWNLTKGRIDLQRTMILDDILGYFVILYKTLRYFVIFCDTFWSHLCCIL